MTGTRPQATASRQAMASICESVEEIFLFDNSQKLEDEKEKLLVFSKTAHLVPFLQNEAEACQNIWIVLPLLSTDLAVFPARDGQSSECGIEHLFLACVQIEILL